MFNNREEAARRLALKLEKVGKGKEAELPRDFLVVAIARGGVVLGRIVADHFNVLLKAVVIKKIGAPRNPELAIGAVGPKKTVYQNKTLIEELGVGRSYKLSAVEEKAQEVKRLEEIFNVNENKFYFVGKKVILVDDGVATGATVLCAQKFLKKEKAKEIILATPVISKESYESIKKYFDKIIVLKIADRFSAVGQFYKDFPQVTNEEVVALMSE